QPIMEAGSMGPEQHFVIDGHNQHLRLQRWFNSTCELTLLVWAIRRQYLPCSQILKVPGQKTTRDNSAPMPLNFAVELLPDHIFSFYLSHTPRPRSESQNF